MIVTDAVVLHVFCDGGVVWEFVLKSPGDV
jgi:hypothetical protein